MERLTEPIKNNKYCLKDLDKGALKLTQFEDFMEKQGFESIEDLEKTIKYIEVAMNLKSINLKLEKDRDNVLNQRAELELKVEQLKDRWDKMKNWILDTKPLVKGAMAVFTKSALLDKIFELEKGQV